MTTLLIACLALSQGGQTPATNCPVMGQPAKDSQPKVLYKGNVFGFCCGGCVGTFSDSPESFLKRHAEADDAVGYSLYDVVSRTIIPKEGKTHDVLYEGVLYRFLTAENAKTFEKEPKKYLAPAQEATENCPVSKEVLKPGKAAAFRDYNGVRYYFCCPDCTAAFDKNPSEFAAKVKAGPAKAHKLVDRQTPYL